MRRQNRQLDTRLSKIAKGDAAKLLFGKKIKKQRRYPRPKKGLPTVRINKSAEVDFHPINLWADITKIDEEKRMVYGTACNEGLDKQDEIVEWDATKDALVEFKKWRNLREMHRDDSAAGTIPLITEDDVAKKFDIGAHVVDEGAWEKVKTGVYKGFSIGGRAIDRVKEFDAELGKNISRVKEYMLTEISLVDRPANPDCLFSMVKRDSYIDPLQAELEKSKGLNTKLSKYVLSEDDVNELKDNEFALVKNYNKDDKNIRERMFPIPDKPHAKAVLKNLLHESLTEREKEIVHDRCKKILGKSHREEDCQYCASVMSLARRRGGDNMDKLAKAAAQLRKAARDLEGVEKPVSPQVEGEDLLDAPQKKTKSPGVDPLEGSKYTDQEGEEYTDEELEDLEGLIAELEGLEEYEGWKGEEGYRGNENLDADASDTHVYNDESEVTEDKNSPDSEDNEGIDDEDLEEDGYERVGKSEVCAYCPTTFGLINKGQTTRAQCPGCGTVYEAEVGLRVGLTKRAGKKSGKVRKSAPARRVDQDGILAGLCDLTAKLSKKFIELEHGIDRTPAQRRHIAKREDAVDEEVKKRDDMVKGAIELRQKLTDERREPTSAETRILEAGLDASLETKLG